MLQSSNNVTVKHSPISQYGDVFQNCYRSVNNVWHSFKGVLLSVCSSFSLHTFQQTKRRRMPISLLSQCGVKCPSKEGWILLPTFHRTQSCTGYWHVCCSMTVLMCIARSLGVPVTDHTFEDCRLMISAGELTLPMEAGLVEFTKISRKLEYGTLYSAWYYTVQLIFCVLTNTMYPYLLKVMSFKFLVWVWIFMSFDPLNLNISAQACLEVLKCVSCITSWTEFHKIWWASKKW